MDVEVAFQPPAGQGAGETVATVAFSVENVPWPSTPPPGKSRRVNGAVSVAARTQSGPILGLLPKRVIFRGPTPVGEPARLSRFLVENAGDTDLVINGITHYLGKGFSLRYGTVGISRLLMLPDQFASWPSGFDPIVRSSGSVTRGRVLSQLRKRPWARRLLPETVFDPIRIPSGEAREFVVAFECSTVGLAADTATVSSNAGQATLSLTGTCTPSAELMFENRQFNFDGIRGADWRSTPSMLRTALLNVANAPISRGAVTIEGPGAAQFEIARSLPATYSLRPRGMPEEIPVAFKCTSGGVFSATLVARGATGTSTARLALVGVCTAPAFDVQPFSFTVGNFPVRPGLSYDWLTVSNRGTATLRLRSFTVTGDHAQQFVPVAATQKSAPTELVVEPGGTGEAWIGYHCNRAPGEYRATLRLSTAASGVAASANDLSVAVPLRLTCVATPDPHVYFSPNRKRITSTVGTPVTELFVMSYRGSSPTIGHGTPRLNGPGASEFEFSPPPAATGTIWNTSSAAFFVRFKCTRPGDATAYLGVPAGGGRVVAIAELLGRCNAPGR